MEAEREYGVGTEWNIRTASVKAVRQEREEMDKEGVGEQGC